jgi:hypothetical protein
MAASVAPASFRSTPMWLAPCSRRPEGSARSSGKHPKATGTGTGFGDLIPQASLRWNAGVHNFMIYGMGDTPVGAYQSTRPSNI